MKSKRKADVQLGRDLSEHLAVELRDRVAVEERRFKIQERQRRQLEMLVSAGKDRQMRERKQVWPAASSFFVITDQCFLFQNLM